MTPLPRWSKYILALLFVLMLSWALGLAAFIGLIPTGPTGDKTAADAIVVLTGGSGRLEHGFELMVAGRAPKMFISGVEDGVTLASLLHRKEYSAFADRIPLNSITLGYKARSTVGNAEETAQWAAREQVKTIRLVTGNYHIPRSIFELHEAMPGVTIIPEPVFPSYFAHNEWWQSAGSILLVVSEYHKYIASIIIHTLLVKS